MGLGTLFARMFSGGSATVTVGHVDDLCDGQMKEVCVDMPAALRTADGAPSVKMLLSRVGGAYHATGHLCTHFKARLVTGRLGADGRVSCPWHAACFDVRTGDIEEAPAVRKLRTYPLTVSASGALEVTLTSADVAPDASSGLEVCPDGGPRTGSDGRIVVVGGGPAGAAAVEAARVAGHAGSIVLVTAEPYAPIDRVKLSKTLALDAASLALYAPKYMDTLDVELRTGVSVTSVDRTRRAVQLSDGTELAYDALVLATGATPRRVPVPGADGAHVLRTLADTASIKAAVDAAPNGRPRVAIVGASWIGLETAAMLSKTAAEVHVIAPEAVPLERLLGRAVGEAVQRMHEFLGSVRFHMGAGVSEIRTDGVLLADGTVVAADIVVLGVGVRPNTDVFAASGFALERDGGLAVDATLALSGDDNAGIYAAGDIAAFERDGRRLRIEHWNVAMQQGRVAGRNAALALADRAAERGRYESTPFFSSLQYGRSLRYTGSAPDGFDADIFLSPAPDAGTPGAPVFAAYYARGDAVVAVATMGADPLAAHCSELMLAGRMPSASQIRAGLSPLDVSF